MVSADCMDRHLGATGASTLSEGGAPSRKAALLHVLRQAWPGKQASEEHATQEGRREWGVGQTKQELNHLNLPTKTLDREAPGAPHSHPVAEAPEMRAAAKAREHGDGGHRDLPLTRRRPLSPDCEA